MNLRKLLLTPLTSVSLLLLLAAPAEALAGNAAQLYASPATASAAQNSNTSLILHVNPGSNSLNTVNVMVAFPANQLQFASLDMSGSGFGTAIPAEPTASDGKLSFSVAKLAGAPIAGDTVVGTLVFSAKAASGSAEVSFAGSQGANDGSAVTLATSPSTISFTAASGAATTIRISNIRATKVTAKSGTITWTTNVTTSSSVAYGPNNKYGFSVGSSALTTNHSLSLGDKFKTGTTVHYQITAVDAKANNATSGDKTFVTRAGTAPVHISNASHRSFLQNAILVALLGLFGLLVLELAQKLWRRRSASKKSQS